VRNETRLLVVAVVFSAHHTSSEGPRLVPYRAPVDVSHELVGHVAWLIRARRCGRRSRWRKPGCFQQALLAPAHLRENETLPALAAGFEVSTATAWRHADATLHVLAAWAPGLHEAPTGLGEGDSAIVDDSRTVHTPVVRTTRKRAWLSIMRV
jgi:hypothetical protein